MAYLKFIIPGAVILLSLVFYLIYQRGLFTLFNNEHLERVDADEAASLIADNTYTILDVRDENEFAISHLEGAIRFEEKVLERLNPKEPVLVYCTVGLRSNKLAQTLREEGFSKIVELQNGLIGWSNAELPMVNSSNSTTDSVHVYNQYFGTLLKKGTAVY